MTHRPFDAIRSALTGNSGESVTGEFPKTRLDPDRAARSGVPEIVYGQGKTPIEILENLRSLAKSNGRALATRCSPDSQKYIAESLRNEFEVEIIAEASAVVVAKTGQAAPNLGGKVAIISAGSSDAAVAAEAALVAREMGAKVYDVRDVGVAGLHRLVQPLEHVVAEGVDVIVVVAGMDGALPSVIKGLVAVPVIGLPTSTGYGFGGDGTAALMSMLQTCAPGMTVVNIDNGVGAGASAALIANRALYLMCGSGKGEEDAETINSPNR